MKIRVNPKEADAIIRALEAGVVPQRGVRHLLVGRKAEVAEVIDSLQKISEGQSDIRFWVGDFGSGKSFMLRTIESIAVQQNFVVSTVDLTPERRFYATDGKARALYTEIIDHMSTQASQNGNTLTVILDEGLNLAAQNLAQSHDCEISAVFKPENRQWMENYLLDLTTSFSSVGLSYELGQAMMAYFDGLTTANRALQMQALRWIRGDIPTKQEAKRELGITKIVTDENWFLMIKNLAELFDGLGYAGFVIDFDEVVNLYKLPRRQTRDANYEKILNLYNECKNGVAKHLFLNFGVTRKTIFDSQRGMASYGALQTRLGSEKSLDQELINTSRTALPLKPLSNEEIFTLLEHLTTIYNTNYHCEIHLSLAQIQTYMEGQLNRPGAHEFLTPRDVIKDYLELLNLVRQNPTVNIDQLLTTNNGRNTDPVEKSSADTDDEIEVW